MYCLLASILVTTSYACRSYYTSDNQEIPLGCVSGIALLTPWEPTEINVHFLIYDQSHLENPQRSVLWNASLDPNESLFNSKDRLKFIIHGYTGSGQNRWISKLKGITILNDPGMKVVVVDWSDGSFFNTSRSSNYQYNQAVNNGLMVGRVVACFIERIISTFGVPEESVHIMGHSLGAQILGLATAWLSERFDRRIGSAVVSEAAAPFLTANGIRPDRKTVHFMLAMHTSVETIWENVFHGAVGVYEAFADVDLYANRGRILQPACREDNYYFCSHDRGRIYLTEMEKNCNETCDFHGTLCGSEYDAAYGTCSKRTVNVCSFIRDLEKSAANSERRSRAVFTFETDMDSLRLECNRTGKQR